MNFNQLWQIFRGRIGTVLVGALGILSLTIFFLAITPRTYTASTSLNFDFNSANPYADVPGTSPAAEGSYIATQIEIMISQAVAQRVFESLSDDEVVRVVAAVAAKRTIIDDIVSWFNRGLDDLFKNEATTMPRSSSPTSKNLAPDLVLESAVKRDNRWLIRSLAVDLSVKPVVGSRIMNIAYTSTDPEIAALLANRYADAYISTNLEMIIDPAQRTKAWFDMRLSTLRDAVSAAQAKLNTYQQEQRIVATDGRFDIENKRLQSLTSELSAAQENRRKLVARKDQAQSMLGSGADLETLPDILKNTVIQSIKADIRAFDSKLAELSNKLGINHPQYQKTLTEIRSAKDKLKAEIRAIVRGIDNEVNVAREEERRVKTALESQKELVLKLKTQRGKIDVLTREVDSTLAVYNSALDQYNKTSLQSLVTNANVTILDQAVTPTRPSGPKIVQNLVLGLIVGLMLGLGLAFFLEILDRRIRSEEDIATELDLPVLGVVLRA